MLYLLPVIVGAFLLFQVQPLIARLLLPFFGGGASVWTACMLFFQVVLLAGYAYAHGLSKLALRRQLQLHTSLLLLSLLALPIGLTEGFSPQAEAPLQQLVAALLLSVGVPYAVLSATGPLLQQWFARQFSGRSPYFLYSWSNAASLLALLSFPFLIEPNLNSQWQTRCWSLGFFGYLLLMLLLVVRLWRAAPTLPKIAVVETPAGSEQALVSAKSRWFWLLYSALGVVFLVATTNAMTQNVAPVPFLWVVPLAIYLLTFIVSFQSTRWYQRSYALWVLGLISLIAVMMHFIGTQFNLLAQLCIYLGLLTVGCLICHAELAKAKPESSQLTGFYLMLALGGCVGSAFVAFIATLMFDQFLEFPLAFVGLLLLLAWQLLSKPDVGAVSSATSHSAISRRVLQFFWHTPARRSGFLALAFAVLSSGLLTELNRLFSQSDVYRTRNFYGVLSVKDVTLDGETERRLIDGSTSHGTQYQSDATKSQPLSYYRPDTGAAHALALKSSEKGPINAGFIGLGAGTLAAYGKAGDQYRFYELNPAVVHVAQKYFSYLSDSKAQISLVEGDGRVSLQQELSQGLPQQFDVLVIDAFAGDSIPQHLLTLEAMALYQQHLAPDGVIAVHISNSHLNLLPLMAGTAQALGWQLGYFMTSASKAHSHQTEWVWLTADPQSLSHPQTRALLSPIDLHGKTPLQWSDQYSDLVSLLK